jgi:2-oxoglutarate dehydrogenase E2 component (dihydrolipoamide succinyltransferase)
MGESLSEGTVTKWLKKPGDRIARDEPLFEISTDKVDTEVPAPASGILEKILVPEGQTVPVGTVVASISSGAPTEAPGPARAGAPAPGPAPAAPPPPAPSAPSGTAPGGGHFATTHEPTTFQRRTAAAPKPSPSKGSAEDKKDYLSPAVIAAAREHQVPLEELSRIQGSGMGGRVTKRDVESYAEKRRAAPPPAPGPPPAAFYPPAPAYPWPPYPYPAYPPPPPPPAPAPPPQALVPASEASLEVPASYLYQPAAEDTVVPMSAMRKKIADHMIWSQRISAQVTSFTECDMHRIVRYRDQHKADFEAAEGFPLTFLPFVAEATIRAIKEFPLFNASVVGDQIVLKKHIHLGIAVALEEGLIVPVVRNADEMNFVGLARAIHDLATRARSRQIQLEEVQGATFTVTNPGMFGGLTGTPMIAQPQVAILGLGAVTKKPVVIEDAIAIRPIMVLALSFDHRIIDGATGFQFIERVRLNLENFEL